MGHSSSNSRHISFVMESMWHFQQVRHYTAGAFSRNASSISGLLGSVVQLVISKLCHWVLMKYKTVRIFMDLSLALTKISSDSEKFELVISELCHWVLMIYKMVMIFINPYAAGG